MPRLKITGTIAFFALKHIHCENKDIFTLLCFLFFFYYVILVVVFICNLESKENRKQMYNTLIFIYLNWSDTIRYTPKQSEPW